MLKLPGSLLARFLHPARRIAPKASCGPRRLPSSGPAPQLAPGVTPPPPRPSEPAPRARLDELRSLLAQKGNFLCITICITLKFTFTSPLGEGFFPSLLESGCSARNLLIFPFHLDFILAAKTSDSLRAVGAGGGRGAFSLGGRGRGTSGVSGEEGVGMLEVAAELGPETHGPGARMGMVWAPASPPAREQRGWIHFKKAKLQTTLAMPKFPSKWHGFAKEVSSGWALSLIRSAFLSDDYKSFGLVTGIEGDKKKKKKKLC